LRELFHRFENEKFGKNIQKNNVNSNKSFYHFDKLLDIILTSQYSPRKFQILRTIRRKKKYLLPVPIIKIVFVKILAQ